MQYSSKIDSFSSLSEKYILVMDKILDYSISKNLLPLKISLGIGLFKSYIQENKIKLIQCGVEYLLNYKEQILNFSLENLDELDSDSDDNSSRKSCMNNISQVKQVIKLDMCSSYKENEILNLIIEIKNKAKKLNETDRSIVKGYIEVLIMILENIRDLFIV
jgi:hypothetical protein